MFLTGLRNQFFSSADSSLIIFSVFLMTPAVLLPLPELVFSEAELVSLPLVREWSGLLVLGLDLVDNSSFRAVSSASILIILSCR